MIQVGLSGTPSLPLGKQGRSGRVRINLRLNIDGCGVVAPPVHFFSSSPTSFLLTTPPSPAPLNSEVARLDRTGRSALVVSFSTCPPASPPAHSFFIGPTVINIHIYSHVWEADCELSRLLEWQAAGRPRITGSRGWARRGLLGLGCQSR